MTWTTGPLVLYDGVCILCNRSISFLLRNDTEGKLHFATLQWAEKKDFAELLGNKGNDSVVLIEKGKVFTRSTAILKATRYLDGPTKLLYALIIVPRPLRDAVYDLIARNRYAWFGRTDQCAVPDPKWKERFLG